MGAVLQKVLQALSDVKLSEWISLYGAVLSSVLAVQALRRRTRVRVTLEVSDAVVPGRPETRQRFLRIRVINKSDHAVRVFSMGLKSRGQFFLIGGPGNPTLPATIPPHDSASGEYRFNDLLNSDSFRNRWVRGFATASTGEAFYSWRTKMRERDRLEPAAESRLT